MRKKKLEMLIITDYFYPHWTGYSKSIYYFVRAVREFANVTILTVRHDKNLKKEEKIFDVNVIREDYLLNISRSKYSLKTIFKFLLIIRKYDLIFINSPCSNILSLSLITKIFRKKLYIFHQGDLILPNSIGNKLIEKIFDLSSYISFLMADKVSSYVKDYAENSRVLRRFLYKFTPLLFPMPIDNLVFNEKNKRGNITDKSNKIFFGFGGRFVHEKGFDILFRAIPIIKKKIPNAYFIFAGDIHMKYEKFFEKNINLFNKVKNDVTILGLLGNKKLKQFYKKIDFIIVPSRSDCFNLMQAEAMFAGVPVIASDIPGLRALVKETNLGILFKKEDHKDLARAVVEVASKKKDILKNYKKILAVFDKKTLILKLRKFFNYTELV